MPDTLRWLWRDYPGIGVERSGPAFELVKGEWELVVSYFGDERISLLRVDRRGDALCASLHTDEDGQVEIETINFSDEVLTFEYATPPSQMDWAKGAHRKMIAWLKVSGESVEGALSIAEAIQLDVSIPDRHGTV